MKQQLKLLKYRLHQNRLQMKMIKEKMQWKITPGLYYHKSLKYGHKNYKACQYQDSHLPMSLIPSAYSCMSIKREWRETSSKFNKNYIRTNCVIIHFL